METNLSITLSRSYQDDKQEETNRITFRQEEHADNNNNNVYSGPGRRPGYLATPAQRVGVEGRGLTPVDRGEERPLPCTLGRGSQGRG